MKRLPHCTTFHIVVSLASLALLLGVATPAAGQSYVEGVSAILSSTNASEIDTWSATYVSPDLAYYYGAYVAGYLYQNSTLIDSGYADRYPWENYAYGGMSPPLVVGDLYTLESDHYLVAFYIYGYDAYNNPLYWNPSYFLPGSGGPDPSGWDFAPGGGNLYYYTEYLYLGTTAVQMSSAAPWISSISPSSGSVGTSGTITVQGEDLIDVFTQTTTPAMTGSGVNLAVASPTSNEVSLSYSIATNASTGTHDLTLTTRFGTSNAAAFNVGDPTPNITSINPNVWNAGTTTNFTISGTGFGTSPSMTINGTGVTSYSVSSASDSQIQASVTIDASAPNGTATVTVTSNGYGNGFVSTNPGQPNNNSANATIQAAPAPAARIWFQGQDITNSTQSVVVGQQIALQTSGQPQGFTVTSNTWTAAGTLVGGYTAGDSSGAVQQPTLSNSSTTFYWVYSGDSLEVTYSYCLDNGQCSPPAKATFLVSGPPTVSVAVSVADVTISSFTDCYGLQGPHLALGTITGTCGTDMATTPPGIHIGVTPSAVSGQYVWVQLVNGDTLRFLPPSTCSGGYGLDTQYPANTGAVFEDSPNFFLDPQGGEAKRSFSAAAYLLWNPQLPQGCTGQQCTSIPVPLGSIQWGFGADAINTLWTGTGEFGTTWKRNTCTAGSAGQFVSSIESDGVNAYPRWSTNTLLTKTCQ